MTVSPVLAKFGRRIRLGVVGGGGNAMIGPVHRVAAQFDSHIEVVAGVLSSDPDRALQQAAAAGIARGYRNVPDMIAAERARSDGIDAICVATPNDSHAHFVGLALDAGLDVICDKPLTNDVASALEIAKQVKASGRVLVLTHNYAGYPMVREARAAVAAGELGAIRVVHVTYFQGSLGSRVEDKPNMMPSRLVWRLDPGKGGESHVMGDIGTHAHQLLTYVTGQNVARVLADVGAALPGRVAHDTGSVILNLSGGARAVRHEGGDRCGERAIAGCVRRAGRIALGAERSKRIAVYAQWASGGDAHKRLADAASSGTTGDANAARASGRVL